MAHSAQTASSAKENCRSGRKQTWTSRNSKLLAVISFVLILAIGLTTAQSLTETLDWMTNTLRPSEGNNVGIHRPFRPINGASYPSPNGPDPYNAETITKFSHDGCKVEFDVDVANVDEILIGKEFHFPEVDTFDLKDIDPSSVRIVGSCASDDAPPPCLFGDGGDMRGKQVAFRTSNAKARIHVENSSSTRTSSYGSTHQEKGETWEKSAERICKAEPSNTSYCNGDHKGEPTDETSSTFWFSTPEYAKRFAKAFQNAVTLCGGKASAF
jgi:hypothetical protein